MVDRYNATDDMNEADDGDYVLYVDHANLESECDALEEERDELKERLRWKPPDECSGEPRWVLLRGNQPSGSHYYRFGKTPLTVLADGEEWLEIPQ